MYTASWLCFVVNLHNEWILLFVFIHTRNLWILVIMVDGSVKLWWVSISSTNLQGDKFSGDATKEWIMTIPPQGWLLTPRSSGVHIGVDGAQASVLDNNYAFSMNVKLKKANHNYNTTTTILSVNDPWLTKNLRHLCAPNQEGLTSFHMKEINR